METEPTLFAEWIDNLTVSGAVNLVLMTSFTIVIIILVARTFRDKSDA